MCKDDLIKHGIKALRAAAQEEELTTNNVSVGVVAADEKFRLLTQNELSQFLASTNENMQIS
jgi:20S proteasome alpha/beta subunit